MNNLAAALLKPAALIYEPVVSLRNLAYSRGWAKVYKAPVPVISIGNITLGGTGKTPITINIARQLIASGKRVAVLSRGYGRKSSGLVVVCDGNKLLCSAEKSGDEPFLIAQSVQAAIVIVAARRAEAATVAVNDFHCDVILLDDGFQHRAMGRDLDIVLVDYDRDLLKDHIFPEGTLREPLAELKRANAIVITNVPRTQRQDNDRLKVLSTAIARLTPNTPQYQCCFIPTRLVPVLSETGSESETAKILQLSQLQTRSVVAFCGIAAPQRFFNQLQDLGLKVKVQQSYGDHHWYQHADVQEIERRLENSSSNLIVTTAKDAVRLQAMTGASREVLIKLPIWYLDMDVAWLSDMQSIISRYANL